MSDNVRPVGPVLDELNVPIELSATQRVTKVLVIAKVTDLESGMPGLVVSHNGLDWIEQWGLLRAAEQVMETESPLTEGDA